MTERRNRRGTTWPWGDGGIDLENRLELAKSRNARCVLETKTVAALKESVRWLGEHPETY